MKRNLLAAAIAMSTGLVVVQGAMAEDIGNIINDGKLMGDFRLRYEMNDMDNDTKTANALTLRSRFGFETGKYYGFSVIAEGVNTAALIDDYAPESTGYSAVGDPTDTALNRLQINYEKDGFNVALGRQRIIFDNARHVGNVGWRQNEQTYDAVKLGYQFNDFNVQYAYIDQVNMVNYKDTDTSHHLINANYSGFAIGSITAYAYLLDDKDTDAKSDTYGARLAGKQGLEDVDVIYSAEFATQKSRGNNAIYMAAEGGIAKSGITAAMGFESLGSDSREYGFQTPLATKHAFNGWADQFGVTPDDGLNDIYFKLGAKVANVDLLAVYHDYEAAKGSNDYGNELNLQAGMQINKHFSAGLKYAMYKKGDASTGMVDDDKAWAWVEAKF